VNFRVFEGSLILRTAQGTKLLELSVNRYVAFEADSWTDTEAASVVVRGVANVVERRSELDELHALGLRPWAPGLKTVFVRIRPAAFAGRRFVRQPKPAPREV
jgi:hypothetical protein